jgi:hypothetical protein
MPRPYRVWLYPLPLVLATAGWIFLFVTSQEKALYALASMAIGVGCYLAWAGTQKIWPFAGAKAGA